MDKYEVTPNVLNIAETCVASISVDDLIGLSEDKDAEGPINTSTKLTYGPIRGSDALRQRLASLYSVRVDVALPHENILITPGAIAANFLVLYSLIKPGDHVICVYPTYQQLYSVPESLGASVSLWKLKKGKKYIPDLSDLDSLLKDNTKMIIINNPNNPTGATIPKSVLKGLIDRARERNIIILSDEVYRPIFHGISPMDAEYPPSLISLGYEKTIVTGSMSKAYSLAGIRIGWIASRDASLIEAFASARDYTTISVSQIDDRIASYALSGSVIHALLGRNIKLAKTNLALLEEFVDEHGEVCSWVKPNAGTTALVRFEREDGPVDDVEFCKDVLEKTKVMFVPANHCFGNGKDFKGFVRIGYVCETEVLKEALERLGMYLKEEFR
jgi:aspartate/methionine/tyrosine aminotransferase